MTVAPLRNNPLHPQFARRSQHRRSWAGEMIEVAQHRFAVGDHGLQQTLAGFEGFVTQVAISVVQQIEHEIHDGRVLLAGEGCLQCGKARVAFGVERNNLTVHQAVGQCDGGLGDRRKPFGPVQASARAQHRLAGFDPKLQAIPIQLQFVHPGSTGGRRVHQLA